MALCYFTFPNKECVRFEFFTYVIVMGSICIFGITANTLLCRIFIKMSRLLSDSSYILLLSVSVADNLLLITMIVNYSVIPVLAFSGLDAAKFIEAAAYIYLYGYFLCNVAHTSSIYVTLVVGISRYIAVCHPFKLDTYFSKGKTMAIIIIVFVISILYHIPPLVECKVGTLNTSIIVLEMIYSFDPIYKLIYDTILYLIVMIVLPNVMLLMICVIVIRRLKHEKATLNSHQDSTSKGERHPSQREIMEKSVTIMLIAVLVVFLLLQSPAGINRLVMMTTLVKWTSPLAWECGGMSVVVIVSDLSVK